MEIIECRPVEIWCWKGRDVWAGAGRLERECVKDDTDELGLHPERALCSWAVFTNMWRGLLLGKTSNPIGVNV